jgi:hypothetical protein
LHAALLEPQIEVRELQLAHVHDVAEQRCDHHRSLAAPQTQELVALESDGVVDRQLAQIERSIQQADVE